MSEQGNRRVLVLVNPRAGLWKSFDPLRRALDQTWDTEGVDLSYQFTQSRADGAAKARRAVEAGVNTVLAVGGDGTVSTIGRALIDSPVALGVIPAGSGNGFARHFGIPLVPDRAARALATAEVRRIDVGRAGGTPFLVTCSMAWDASIVRSFERFPFRGILPYLLAGVQEFFEYDRQAVSVELDSGESLTFDDPVVFTIANLTQYGGGAKIAPSARADDGQLELVVALRDDAPRLLANIGRLFDGTIGNLPEIVSRKFRRLTVRRRRPGPMQMDGELTEAPAELEIEAVPASLSVLVPRPATA